MKSMEEIDKDTYKDIWREYFKNNPELLREYERVEFKNEWQLCPKCEGEGKKPQIQMTSLGPLNVEAACDLCNGKKIISKINGLPPQ